MKLRMVNYNSLENISKNNCIGCPFKRWLWWSKKFYQFFQMFKPIQHDALTKFYTKYSKPSFFKMLLEYTKNDGQKKCVEEGGKFAVCEAPRSEQYYSSTAPMSDNCGQNHLYLFMSKIIHMRHSTLYIMCLLQFLCLFM